MKKIVLVFLYLILLTSPALAGRVNDKAPAIELADTSGKPVSLEGLKGKVVFINFWASWCGPCKVELPELIKLTEKYKDKDFVLLAVNIDKTKGKADTFLSKLPARPENFVVACDPESKVVSSYGGRAMPTSFVLDKGGVIKYVHLGFNEADPAKWVAEIESLLK